MPNHYLSVLYKHMIQVENKNVGLKVWVGGGGRVGHKHTIAPPPPNQKRGHMPPCRLPPPPPASYASDITFIRFIDSFMNFAKDARCRPEMFILLVYAIAFCYFIIII